MIRAGFKIAIRYFFKNKGTSILNVLGLSVGIACSILSMLYVVNELSYDRFHQNADRIHRVAVRALIGDTKINQTYSSSITFQKLLEDFPEIINGVKISDNSRLPVINGDNTFYESRILSVDSTFFRIFSIPLIHGDAETVLNQPNTMVITESTALKYFDKTDVVGNTLVIDLSAYGLDKVHFSISGVSEDVPSRSHFHYDFLVSLVTFPDLINNPGWSANNFKSYIVLEEGVSRDEVEIKLEDFTRKYMGGDDFDAWVANGNFWEYYLQPVTSIHLNSDLNGEFEANGNQTYVNIFLLLSIVIILIACINFMNLSTAKSSLRAREVGMRKVAGSGRSGLILQFLSESILLSFVSLAFAMLLVHLLLPYYGDFAGVDLEIKYLENLSIIPLLIMLGLVVGVVSGSYPAFVLSSFKPISALKGSLLKTSGNQGFRNVLVIFQFSISIFLIIGTMVVYKQLEYFQNKKLGFQKEHVLVINNPGTLVDQIDPFKEELRKQTSVVSVSGSNLLPGQSFSNIGFGAEGVQNFTLNIGACDYDFIETLEMEMVKGRFFSRDFESDSNAVVVNQRTAELLGWDEPLGKEINNWSNERGEFIVIGVVKDFHYESLHQEIRPMALFLTGGYYDRVQSSIALRLNAEDLQASIEFIEETWNNFTSEMPFEYSFLDDNFDSLYANEVQTRGIFTIFSFLAIFIACLGLFGLATFMAEQKTKEIGIRKALGASVQHIIRMLNKGFTKWVIIASLIAWPLAWFSMDKWLQNFAYRIDLSWWMFVIAAGAALFVALAVVSLETVKAALRNPVESLKYE